MGFWGCFFVVVVVFSSSCFCSGAGARTTSDSVLCVSIVTCLYGLASLAPGTCPGISFGTIIVLLSKLNPLCKTVL